MGHVADIIEQFILKKLSNQKDDILVLQRNELAGWIECAPSQVSYVLSTRFTVERGFIVESRRGSGGFVRIARLPLEEMVHHEIGPGEVDLTYQEALNLMERLKAQRFITRREAALIEHFFSLFYETLSPEVRLDLVRSVLMVLAKNS